MALLQFMLIPRGPANMHSSALPLSPFWTPPHNLATSRAHSLATAERAATRFRIASKARDDQPTSPVSRSSAKSAKRFGSRRSLIAMKKQSAFIKLRLADTHSIPDEARRLLKTIIAAANAL